ncbi:MAG: hypothetical protein ACJ8MR_01200 [Povalibacter sp.]
MSHSTDATLNVAFSLLPMNLLLSISNPQQSSNDALITQSSMHGMAHNSHTLNSRLL